MGYQNDACPTPIPALPPGSFAPPISSSVGVIELRIDFVITMDSL